MPNIDALLDRNREFASTGGHKAAVLPPRNAVLVITCLDPRVDPSAFLQLDLADAMVIRNGGGRVTPDVLTNLAFLDQLIDTLIPDGGLPLEVAVVHHTGCGTGYLADPDFRARFADRVGVEQTSLLPLAVTDPAETVRADVQLIRTGTAKFPAHWTVSGHVYDLETGLVTTVVPAN